MAVSEFIQFWGKARPEQSSVELPEQSSVEWHPVAYHLLDVAAAADALLHARPFTRRRAAWLFGIPEAEAHSLLVALCSLHDIGKFAPAFQRLANPGGWVWPTVLAGEEGRFQERSRHTQDGLFLWQRCLRNDLARRIWPAGLDALFELDCAVFGHHGRPVDGGSGPVAARFGAGTVRAATDCVKAILDLVQPTPVATPPQSSVRYRIVSWWLSGFITLADWIGSRQAWFPYEAPMHDDLDLSAYWTLARGRAEVAVREAGLVPPRSAALKTFKELTHKAIPTPIQAWAETVTIPEAPALFIIEDATGSGKTEAAQMLVHRMMASRRASGAYWAMPTQATANAMYARQFDAIGALFSLERDQLVSLTLGHGQARLHDRYRSTVIRAPDDEREPLEHIEPADPDSAAVACAAFLADDRRVALLADIGVGTVDQALLGVLPSRFATVRLFALSEKVLVLDEVHAFDAYMSTEANQLLRFHAALGGSAVLLSATLPEPRRRELEQAWRCVDRFGPPPLADVAPSPYPLATCVNGVSGETLSFTPPAVSVAQQRTPVRLVHDEDVALKHLLDATALGASGVWIRNTVDECLRTAAMLSEAGRSPLVFHARFAQGDRQRIERNVMSRFGVASTADERRGAILVATQVVEQSLDLDFDVMISDLAPIDLLIQRAGRLWRHRHRPRPIPIEELLVLCPSVDGDIQPQWPDPLLRNTRYVYDDVGILWRTVRALQESPVISVQRNLRSLIARVYEGDDVPELLERRQNIAIGEGYAAVAYADASTLRLREGYAAGANWSDDLRSRTRLGEEQVPVRLARFDGNRIEPWVTDADMAEWKHWALSEVKLSAKRVSWEAQTPPEWTSRVDRVRESWSRFEQRTPVVVLQETSDGVWEGSLRSGTRDVALVYRQCLGLSYGSMIR